MKITDLVYEYNPEPEKPWFSEGATDGWLVLSDGRPGPAKIAKAVVIADDEGQIIVDNGEFEDCEVVDDTPS